MCSKSPPEDSDHEGEKIIGILEAYIQAGNEGRDEKGKMMTVFKAILSNAQVQIPAGLHCEILIATLGWKRCWQAAIKNDDTRLQDLCQV